MRRRKDVCAASLTRKSQDEGIEISINSSSGSCRSIMQLTSSLPASSSFSTQSSSCRPIDSASGSERKWSNRVPVITPSISLLLLLLLTDAFAVLVVAGKHFKCDFQKFPESGCQDPVTTTCNSETDQCVCRPAYPVNVNGRCFAYRDISDLCVTSRQCSRIRAKCIDNAGDEVVANEDSASLVTSTTPPAATSSSSKPNEGSLRMMVGVCKCPEGLFHHPEKNECSVRILGRKCYFNTDCESDFLSFCYRLLVSLLSSATAGDVVILSWILALMPFFLLESRVNGC